MCCVCGLYQRVCGEVVLVVAWCVAAGWCGGRCFDVLNVLSLGQCGVCGSAGCLVCGSVLYSGGMLCVVMYCMCGCVWCVYSGVV